MLVQMDGVLPQIHRWLFEKRVIYLSHEILLELVPTLFATEIYFKNTANTTVYFSSPLD